MKSLLDRFEAATGKAVLRLPWTEAQQLDGKSYCIVTSDDPARLATALEKEPKVVAMVKSLEPNEAARAALDVDIWLWNAMPECEYLLLAVDDQARYCITLNVHASWLHWIKIDVHKKSDLYDALQYRGCLVEDFFDAAAQGKIWARMDRTQAASFLEDTEARLAAVHQRYIAAVCPGVAPAARVPTSAAITVAKANDHVAFTMHAPEAFVSYVATHLTNTTCQGVLFAWTHKGPAGFYERDGALVWHAEGASGLASTTFQRPKVQVEQLTLALREAWNGWCTWQQTSGETIVIGKPNIKLRQTPAYRVWKAGESPRSPHLLDRQALLKLIDAALDKGQITIN